ncbi:hypothetical protein PG996_011216 [Apiospora saccharicola]|uniref:DUF8035 domain-containing protein n=1 Tax=Apiospora saccharicola TaxID=335842 RepID=A0ABR1UEG3_9PEZI
MNPGRFGELSLNESQDTLSPVIINARSLRYRPAHRRLATEADDHVSVGQHIPHRSIATAEGANEESQALYSGSNEATRDPTQDDHSPKQEQAAGYPLEGILEKPASDFPGPPEFTREGVSTPSRSDGPSGARWTKINRSLVNPEALTIGKERFEERDDFVIVLRVLSKEEVWQYAKATTQLREERRREGQLHREGQLSYQSQCKICRDIEEKQRKITKAQKGKGDRNGTSERVLMALKTQIQQLEERHYKGGHDVSLDVESAEV